MIGERTEGPHSLRERSPGNLILTTVCTVLEFRRDSDHLRKNSLTPRQQDVFKVTTGNES